ncbi:Protein kinase domain [Dillenia turbinata]|uniref:Protein kinase domain n=1 Tax=Dillenia turbinata TaxID=194707 RepID=A0AAN8U6Z7_9MAGN
MSLRLKKDYQLCEEIGRGRFGVVYRCFSTLTGNSFACKSVDKTQLLDEIDRECLDKETKIMNHVVGSDNIVNLIDVYEDETHLHMILDLCQEQTLYDRILQINHSFSESEACAIFTQLIGAIAHCHKRGVAHRDLKPDNVLFDQWNNLKLADFGSAEWVNGDEKMEGIVGTPYYVAPEVILGREYNEKVDVWSAGVILYIMLSGIPPFYGESPADIFEAVIRGNLRFPPRIFRSVSSSAKDLIRKMLCRDVSRRLSAEQVLGK